LTCLLWLVFAGAQQQQYAGAQHETTSMAVQHALEAQQAANYVATLEQHNAQQQQVRHSRLSLLLSGSKILLMPSQLRFSDSTSWLLDFSEC